MNCAYYTDRCWDNVTAHDLAFKMSFKMNAPPEASLLLLLQFCSSISSATLSSAPHRWMISCTIIDPVCVYLHLLCVRLCGRHYRECRREERMKEFFFNYYMTDSVLDANEIYRNPGILIFNVLQEKRIPLSSLSWYQNLL